jgi:hypothetical protein
MSADHGFSARIYLLMCVFLAVLQENQSADFEVMQPIAKNSPYKYQQNQISTNNRKSE